MEKVLASSWQDVRYALRIFRRAPLFVCGVAGTIGIGLGFVCSAFTVVNVYLLKPYELRDLRVELGHALGAAQPVQPRRVPRTPHRIARRLHGCGGVYAFPDRAGWRNHVRVAAIVEAVRPFGVAPLAAASAIVISASLVAAAVPSFRAGRVDPAAALRSE
jgi:ABC-type antimicrobial peptide transport system permease subunit